MDRRKFLKKSLATTAVSTLGTIPLASAEELPKRKNPEKLISSYYFRAHMYTIVPHQVREDLQWMADHGTNAVDLAIIEQDLFATQINVDIIANEAAKLGMKVFMVPSRWGGIIAGAPKVPSIFAVNNPHTWRIKPNGEPVFDNNAGVYCSIFYDEVVDFFKTTAEKAINLWGISGVIWDEPKGYRQIDHSEEAVKKLGKNAPKKAYIAATSDFYSEINTYIKEKHPEVSTHLFLYAGMKEPVMESASKIKHLDYFGCDGKPWKVADKGHKKVLLENGERFLPAAKKASKKSLWLIENFDMSDEDIALMDKRLPEVLAKDVDHLIYYYYGIRVKSPQRNMDVMGKHLKSL